MVALLTAAAVLIPKHLDGAQAHALAGIWQGALAAGPAQLRLVLKVSQGPGGALTATMDSVDQGAMNLPVDLVQIQNGNVRLEMKQIGGLYEGRMNEAGTEISGRWSQGGRSLPLTFRKAAKPLELSRPQDPKPPYPYEVLPVDYENNAGGVHLAGTLTRPRGGGPFPAVLLISGSGPQDRNESVMGHRPFLVLADRLTRRGIVVLRVDDRGVGGSTGSTPQATSEDLAGDVTAGIEFLKRVERVDPQRIGLLGHSEGALIAPMVASRSSDVAFAVLIAGPAIPGEQILYAQGAAIAKAAGVSQQAIERNRRRQERIFSILKAEKDHAAAEKKIREEWPALIAELTSEEKRALGGAPEKALEAQLRMVLSPWFRFFLTYDPAPALRKMKCPVLAVYGERDLQVPPEISAPAVEAALKAAGNRNFKVVVLPGLNHLLQTCRTGSPAEYGRIEETIAPQALEVIGDWIVKFTESAPRKRKEQAR